MRIHIINGPNLNLLGTREPQIYGVDTLDDIKALCADKAAQLGFELIFSQSNHEGEIVEWIQQARGEVDAIILNAGAYTHTSVAIHDALKTFDNPIMEVHISNPMAREEFRHVSYVSPLAKAVIAGCGVQGYIFALENLANMLPKQSEK